MNDLVASGLTALHLELGTASVLVQLLLIFVLVAVFAGRRRMAARRDAYRLVQTPLPPVSPATPLVVRRVAAGPDSRQRISEELLPVCFADTCADWAQLSFDTDPVRDTRYHLPDWSAPTDRVALDPAPALPERPPAASTMSCTIAPQVHHCA